MASALLEEDPGQTYGGETMTIANPTGGGATHVGRRADLPRVPCSIDPVSLVQVSLGW